MSIKHKVLSNTFYLFADSMVITILSFLFWFIIGKMLTPSDTGVISTSINSSILIATFCIFGLNATLHKLIPEYLERKENKETIGIIRFSTRIVVFASILTGMVLVLLSPQIAGILKVPSTVVLIIAALTISNAISRIFQAVLYGYQNMKRIFISNFFGYLIKIILSITLITLGFGIFGPLAATLICFITIGILAFNFKWFITISTQIKRKWIISEYAIPTFIAAILMIFLRNGIYTLLAAIKDPQTTGIFTIGMVISTPLTIIPSILSSATFPIISQLSVSDDFKTRHISKTRQSKLIRIVFKYSLFLSLPMASFLIFFSRPVILFYSSSEYLAAASLLPLLTFGSVLSSCGSLFASSLYATGKPKTRRNIIFLTTSVFFILSLPLTSYFSAFGMSVAYTTAMLIFTIFSFFYLKHALKLNLEIVAATKMLISCFLAFWLISQISIFTMGVLFLIAAALIGGLIYMTILTFLKFYSKEDFEILELAAKKLPIFRKEFGKLIESFSKFYFKLFPEKE